MVYLDCAQYDCCHNKAGPAAWAISRCTTQGKKTRSAAATAVTRAWAMWLPTMPRLRRKPRSAAMIRGANIWKAAVAVPIMSVSTSAAAGPNVPPARRHGKAGSETEQGVPAKGTPCFLRLRKRTNRCIIRRYSRRRMPAGQFIGNEAQSMPDSPIKVPFVSFRPMEKELDGDLRAAFDRVLQNSWYIEGNEDAAFEKAFAAYCGTEFCIGCGNGLDSWCSSSKRWASARGMKSLYRPIPLLPQCWPSVMPGRNRCW